MRILTLLTALLLLAFQAQAQTLQETADQVPAQDQPEIEDQDQPGDEDQDLLGNEDQDVTISFPGDERFTRQLTAPGVAKILAKVLAQTVTESVLRRCHCRLQHTCSSNKVNKALDRFSGICRIFGSQRRLCCS